MIDFIKNFHADEDGAVTVDWVVLTAAVVALGVGAVSVVGGSIDGLAAKIQTSVNSATLDNVGPLSTAEDTDG